jgi:excisionase family DNA binding protein
MNQRQPAALFVPDAARVLGITKQQVLSLIETGQLRGVRDRWTAPRIPVEAVEEFVSDQGGWQSWKRALRADRDALVKETERIRARTKAAELSRVEASLPALAARARAISTRNGRRQVRRVLDDAEAAGIPMSPEKARRIAARKTKAPVNQELVAARVRATRQSPVAASEKISVRELKRRSRQAVERERGHASLPPKERGNRTRGATGKPGARGAAIRDAVSRGDIGVKHGRREVR